MLHHSSLKPMFEAVPVFDTVVTVLVNTDVSTALGSYWAWGLPLNDVVVAKKSAALYHHNSNRRYNVQEVHYLNTNTAVSSIPTFAAFSLREPCAIWESCAPTLMDCRDACRDRPAYRLVSWTPRVQGYQNWKEKQAKAHDAPAVLMLLCFSTTCKREWVEVKPEKV